MVEHLVKGIIVGLGASIPLGPIGVLCIQRTLSKGRNSGLISGMGTAVTDTFFAAIAVLSLTFIQDLITEYKDWVMLFGGIIVFLFGLQLFFRNPVTQIHRLDGKTKKYWQDFFSAILMTISNPGALFLILGLLALMGLDTSNIESSYTMASTLWGVFIGCSVWWFTLSTTINIFRNKFRLKILILINRVSGVVIMVLGIISCFQGLLSLIKLIY